MHQLGFSKKCEDNSNVNMPFQRIISFSGAEMGKKMIPGHVISDDNDP